MLTLTKKLKLLKRDLIKGDCHFIAITGENDFLANLVSGEIRDILRQRQIPVVQLEAQHETEESFHQKFSEINLFQEKTAYFLSGSEQNQQVTHWLSKLKKEAFHGSPLILFHKRGVLTQAMKKEFERLSAFEILCKELKNSNTEELVYYLCDKNKVSFEQNAFRYFYERVKNNIPKALNEIEKVSLIVQEPQHKITLEEVKKYLETKEEKETFLLTSLLLEKKIEKAQIHIQELIHSGESPLSLLGLISYFCRTALYLRTQKNTKKSGTLQTSSIKLPYFLINRYNRHLSLHTEENLKQALEKCMEADLLLKSRPKQEHVLHLSKILAVLSN